MSGTGLWAVIIIYLVLTIGAGVISARREEQASAKGYFHSTLPPWIMVFTMVATIQSGVQFVGLPGTVSIRGVGLWIAGNISGMIGLCICNYWIAKPMRKLAETREKVTIIDMICDIFNCPSLRYLAVPAMLITTIAVAVANWVSLGQLLYLLLGVDYAQAVIVGAVVVGLYAILGGNKSTAIVSAIQMVIAMISTIVVVIMALRVGGGFVKLNQDVAAINPEFLNLYGEGGAFKQTFWYYLIIYSIGMIGQPHICVKYFQIKDAKLLPQALFLGLFSFSFTCLSAIVGQVVMVKVAAGEMAAPPTYDGAMSAFILQYCNPVIGGLLVAACLAAIMSTVAALLLTASSNLMLDIVGGWFKVDMSGKKGARMSQLGMLIALVVSAGLALDPTGDVYTLGAAGWGAYAACFTACVGFGLRWRRATKQGAWAAMTIGVLFYIIPTGLQIATGWKWPFKWDNNFFGFVISIIAMIVVSLLTPAQDKSYFMPPTAKELKKLVDEERALATAK